MQTKRNMTLEIKVYKANKIVCSICKREMQGYSITISLTDDKNIALTLLPVCFMCYHEIFLKPYYQSCV